MAIDENIYLSLVILLYVPVDTKAWHNVVVILYQSFNKRKCRHVAKNRSMSKG